MTSNTSVGAAETCEDQQHTMAERPERRLCSRRRHLMLAALVMIWLATPAGMLRAQQATEPAATTTEKDQTDLAVTVYNSDVALVRDVRQVNLGSGIFPLHFVDVASSINPATVHFRSLSDPAGLSVIEQDYEYDLLNPAKLLQKYVGHEITLVRQERENGSTKWVETKATLVSNNDGPVFKIGNEIVTGMAVDSYRFPDLPENLYSRPTLVWTLENKGPRAQRVEASYLTADMNWSADYVLTVGRDEKAADLDGWVTLVNNSGAAYKNAKLQLVAGEIHRSETPQPRAMDAKGAAPMARMAPAFSQEAFSEYHLYSLERRTSIQNKESKQISLLSATGVPVGKFLLIEGQSSYFRAAQGLGNPIPEPVKVYYRFRNDEKSNLGMPLPAGTVRVYQADSKGSALFAGEDRINHTPKDEEVKIYVGNAFDVVAERKRTDYRRLANDIYEEEFQITVRNHKDGPVTVEVREPVGGDWEIISSTYKATKLDANTIGFTVPVEKDGSATLDYRARIHY